MCSVCRAPSNWLHNTLFFPHCEIAPSPSTVATTDITITMIMMIMIIIIIIIIIIIRAPPKHIWDASSRSCSNRCCASSCIP